MGLKRMYFDLMRKLKGRKDRNTVFDGIADAIFNGEIAHSFNIQHFFDKCGCDSSIIDEMNENTNYAGKIHVVEEEFCSETFRKMADPIFEEFQKCEPIAEALKRKGDRFKNRAQFPQALRSYRLAAQYTDSDSKIMVDIYWETTRIALWFYSDSDGALKLHQAAKQCKKYRRHKTRFAAQRDHCRSYLNVHLPLRLNPEMSEYSQKNIFQVYGEPNEDAEALSSSVCIAESPTHGLGTFVTETLDPGTPVIVEKPYTTVLTKCFTWDARYCFRCLRNLTGCVPCNNCIFYMYCSIECRDTDYEDGHKYECPCLPFILALKHRDAYHVCLKAICKAGPKTLAIACKTIFKDPLSLAERNVVLKDRDGEIDEYSKVMNLCSHPDLEQLNTIVWTAYTLAYVLEHKSEFFNEYKETRRPTMANFIAAAIVHHMFSFRFNAFSLYVPINVDAHFHRDKSKPAPSPEFRCIGTGIYHTASIINHSCDPNVTFQHEAGGTLSMITNRKLPAGSQLFFSYGPTYTGTGRDTRRKCMNIGYGFECKCTACLLNWKTHREFQDDPKRLMCTECSFHTLKQGADYEKYVLTVDEFGFYGSCEVCEETFDMEELWKEVRRHDEMLNYASELLDSNKPIEALPIIKMCILFYQSNMCPPSIELVFGQSLLRDALTLVSNPYE